MLVLVHGSPTTLEREHGHHPNLGVLSSPRRVYAERHSFPWAADNDAYLAWDETRFRRMLDTITGLPGCLFVTAPDVVGDAAATLERFEQWHDTLAGFPVALVGQDGLENLTVPWNRMAAFFIGGSTEWKLSTAAAELARHARRHGLWVHMGRVNTRRRVRYAQSIGCDSVDGTNFSMYRRTNLPWALEMCRGGRQLALEPCPL